MLTFCDKIPELVFRHMLTNRRKDLKVETVIQKELFKRVLSDKSILPDVLGQTDQTPWCSNANYELFNSDM